ncbi:secretogranin-2b [Nelusetta ayraudi]|uniref:secretogranin-2b n=1 Tax=Nelusetta ayraudi TaxID=303726 RepID=UPI003F7270BB
MLHFHHKLPSGGAVVLLAFLLHGCAVQVASIPHHYKLRGGESDGQPAAYSPGSDLIKALEYIENLKQRSGGRAEPVDYDEVDKFKVLLQLAAQQDEGPGERQPAPGMPRQDITAEQLMKALLRSLQGQEKMSPALAAPKNERRTHRHRTKDTEIPAESAPADYGNFPRPHKKYPLMFEDEEDADAAKRATEDLDEQYTPQSLANLRSIFNELGRMPTVGMGGQKRNVFGDDDNDEQEGGVGLKNQAYEDVAGGEEWVPMEEREETEEMVNRSHEEMERALDEQEEAEREMQRRASQDQEGADDDTKLVDYYLLKVLEMSDQSQKREAAGEQRKRLIRPSIVDPRTVKELLELSLKLHVPPQDLIDRLLTEELRKLHRDPQTSSRFTGQSPKIRYFSRRLPVKSKPAPEDMDREDFLDIIGVETISNEYPVVQRPLKTSQSSDRIQIGPNPAANPVPVKIPSPSGRRENLFLSELNKMPLKRQADGADDEDDDGDVEDEVTTYLAAKILTEYPNTITKRDTQSQLKNQLRYELYERALKDYLGQAEPAAKKEGEAATEEKVKPTEMQGKEEVAAKTSAPETVKEEEKEHREKQAAGM